MVGSIMRAHTPGRTGRSVASVISALYTELLVLVALPASARARRQSIARHIISHIYMSYNAHYITYLYGGRALLATLYYISKCNIMHIILHIYMAAERCSPHYITYLNVI